VRPRSTTGASTDLGSSGHLQEGRRVLGGGQVGRCCTTLPRRAGRAGGVGMAPRLARQAGAPGTPRPRGTLGTRPGKPRSVCPPMRSSLHKQLQVLGQSSPVGSSLQPNPGAPRRKPGALPKAPRCPEGFAPPYPAAPPHCTSL